MASFFSMFFSNTLKTALFMLYLAIFFGVIYLVITFTQTLIESLVF